MDKTKTRDITVRVFAVLIAFVLWIYVAADDNPEMSVEIPQIPVKLTNIETLQQQGLILIGNPNDYTIKIPVKGRSQDIRQIRAQDFIVEANLGIGSRFKGENNILVEIKDKPGGVQISNQSIYIKVELDELVEKSLPVTLSLQGNLKEGYARLNESIKPAQAIIRGAARYIGRVNSVVAKLDINDAVSDIQTSLPLQVLDKDGKVVGEVECIPRTVDVTVPIRKSKVVPINIRLTGRLPEGVFLIDTVSDPANVTITGEEDIVNSITAIDTAPINFDDINSSVTRQVNINIPEGAMVIENIQAVNVHVNVEKTINKTYNVPMEYFNLPGGLTADFLTNTITMTLSGRESIINRTAASDITAKLDLVGIPTEDGEYEFSPQLNFPEELVLREVNPQRVKVRITKEQG
ncbi:YbbR-like protein [Oxobacter pfennigii]|uniref:YbbR-like protein n=1 Tax=Oxobacter pfennigii TaxID=36849 RepID=A0A0P8WUD5_9CLOT|nr:CdaR family protein [Oxobacter pfennigii]KPU46325.1 YbbR-like protein [Oxobacter pfennigii]